MNESYPKASLKLLESRLKFLNSETTNNKEEKEEASHKINHIKKVFILNKKTKEFIKRNSNIKAYNKNFCKKNTNYDPKKKIRLIKSKYFHNELLRKNINSPLKREYKLLISNLPNNKRCFINLHNKDFDNIFKYPNNSMQNIVNKKEIIKKNNINLDKKRRIDNSIESKKDSIESTKTIHYKIPLSCNMYKSKSVFFDKKDNDIFNYTYKKKDGSLSSINKTKQKIKLIDKNKKYLKLLSLLKKRSNKTFKLLSDVKREEIKDKDSFLSSLARFSVIRERIKRNLYY